jgi:hypothetical protein
MTWTALSQVKDLTKYRSVAQHQEDSETVFFRKVDVFVTQLNNQVTYQQLSLEDYARYDWNISSDKLTTENVYALTLIPDLHKDKITLTFTRRSPSFWKHFMNPINYSKVFQLISAHNQDHSEQLKKFIENVSVRITMDNADSPPSVGSIKEHKLSPAVQKAKEERLLRKKKSIQSQIHKR